MSMLWSSFSYNCYLYGSIIHQNMIPDRKQVRLHHHSTHTKDLKIRNNWTWNLDWHQNTGFLSTPSHVQKLWSVWKTEYMFQKIWCRMRLRLSISMCSQKQSQKAALCLICAFNELFSMNFCAKTGSWRTQGRSAFAFKLMYHAYQFVN